MPNVYHWLIQLKKWLFANSWTPLGLTWEEKSLSTLNKMRVLTGIKMCRNGYWVGSCHMQADIYKGVSEVLTRMSWSCPWAKPSTLWPKKQAQLCGSQWSDLGSESVIQPETEWFDLGLWQVEQRPACAWKSSVITACGWEIHWDCGMTSSATWCWLTFKNS